MDDGFSPSMGCSFKYAVVLSFRTEEKLIVSEFRKSVTCFPATNGQRSIANVVDSLTYIDEMVYGKALTILEQPTVNQFIILSCSFPLILVKKKKLRAPNVCDCQRLSMKSLLKHTHKHSKPSSFKKS